MKPFITKINTEEEYQKALSDLTEWMKENDKPAPPNVEALIQAIVNYEDEHFPMTWEES